MSHPPSDPDREQRQRTNPASVSRVDLFSHPAPPEMVEQHRQPADGVALLEGRAPVDGHAAAYVCERFVCQAPVTSAEELEASL